MRPDPAPRSADTSATVQRGIATREFADDGDQARVVTATRADTSRGVSKSLLEMLASAREGIARTPLRPRGANHPIGDSRVFDLESDFARTFDALP